MKWKTTVVSSSVISEDGDATLGAWTEFTFGSGDLWSNLPGYEELQMIAGDEIDEILGEKPISYWFHLSSYAEYVLGAPDLKESPKSWGRLIWMVPVEVNVDTQEQVDALIGLTHEGTDEPELPF